MFVSLVICASLSFSVKKLHVVECQNFLRLWNPDTKSNLDDVKELPKLNQVHFEALSVTTSTESVGSECQYH